MRVTTSVAAVGLIASCLAAQTRAATGPMEPDARLWKTGVINSAAEQRPTPPRGRAESLLRMINRSSLRAGCSKIRQSIMFRNTWPSRIEYSGRWPR